ncbi:MAG: trypsin-like peptidase domain-containing protein [Akkermansiaceae bacterium]|jgi:serine protease Do|nr:trypsin-like peptidase domain-containing protein [Akkermansiaceae bacterium]
MRFRHTSLLIFSSIIILISTRVLSDENDRLINDASIKVQFERKLGKLKDAKQTTDTSLISTQLKEQNKIHAELPEISNTNLKSSEIYTGRKNGVLCLGNIYKCDRCSNWHGNIAGGFIITKDGLAVTNYHVMKNSKAGAFGAMTIQGEIYPIEKIVASSEKDDLAIVKLKGDKFKPLPIAKSAPVGSDVTVISHPEGRFYTVSRGIISRYYKQRGGKEKGSPRLAITADFAKGSSGSPVFDTSGSVIGVVAATNSIYYNKTEGIERNLQMVVKSCIPSSSILKLLNSATP